MPGVRTYPTDDVVGSAPDHTSGGGVAVRGLIVIDPVTVPEAKDET